MKTGRVRELSEFLCWVGDDCYTDKALRQLPLGAAPAAKFGDPVPARCSFAGWACAFATYEALRPLEKGWSQETRFTFIRDVMARRVIPIGFGKGSTGADAVAARLARVAAMCWLDLALTDFVTLDRAIGWSRLRMARELLRIADAYEAEERRALKEWVAKRNAERGEAGGEQG